MIESEASIKVCSYLDRTSAHVCNSTSKTIVANCFKGEGVSLYSMYKSSLLSITYYYYHDYFKGIVISFCNILNTIEYVWVAVAQLMMMMDPRNNNIPVQ